jgi:thioesterase domain-containing protein
VWEELLRVEHVGGDDNFFELGGHSLLATQMLARVEQRTGRKGSLAAFFLDPTVSHLAFVIREESWNNSLLVKLREGTTDQCFFGIHTLGSGLNYLQSIASKLGPEWTIYALQPPDLDEKQLQELTVEGLASRYIAQILKVRPRGPYHIGGHSFGGLVAYEIGQQLSLSGEEVGTLALFDTQGPVTPDRSLGARVRRIGKLLRKADWHGRRAKDLSRRIREASGRQVVSEEHARLSEMALAQLRASASYSPRQFPGAITLFQASAIQAGAYKDPYSGWDGMAAAGLEIVEVPGNHVSVIDDTNIDVLAAELAGNLARKAAGDDARS